MTRGHELAVRVDAYAGGAGDEEPRAIAAAGRWVEVREVEGRWREPRGRYFRVALADGSRTLLLCREEDATWWRVLERAREH